MDLKTKPSDTPNSNNFFSMLTQQSGQNSSGNNHLRNDDLSASSKNKANMISTTSQKQMPLTTRQTTSLQQIYESIAKPFFNAAAGASS